MTTEKATPTAAPYIFAPEQLDKVIRDATTLLYDLSLSRTAQELAGEGSRPIAKAILDDKQRELTQLVAEWTDAILTYQMVYLSQSSYGPTAQQELVMQRFWGNFTDVWSALESMTEWLFLADDIVYELRTIGGWVGGGLMKIAVPPPNTSPLLNTSPQPPPPPPPPGGNGRLPDPFGPRIRSIPTPGRLPDPFVTLSPQARDRAQIAVRDQGRGPGGPPGESGPPVLPGSNPMGIPMGRSSRFTGFDGGPRHATGDTPWVAPKPKAGARNIRGPNPPMPGPGRRGDTGPNPAPQKRAAGSDGSPAPNPRADRSTDSKSASVEGRADPKPATETKTETPTATLATDQKAPPPTDTTGGGTTGGGGTSTDSKDDKKAPYYWAGPDYPTSGSMPNPEDDGSGGTGSPHANPGLGDGIFDPKLFRFRVPGALGDMPSDEGGAGSGGGIGGPRSYGGQNQNPNPEDQGTGGRGGPRAYGSSSRSSFGGPRSYDAYPDPESTGGGGPRGRYNERPNPEDTAGPRGPNARNRSAIGPWSASRNRML